MNVVIIDDEEQCRVLLRKLFTQYCSVNSVIGEANGVKSGIELIKKNKPDLVFLDIQMNDGTGFDLLDQIDDIQFKVIFITAFDNYAIKAFKYSAIHYILKPIDYEELKEAYKRCLADNHGNNFIPNAVDSYRSGKFESLVLKNSGEIHCVNFTDIEYIQAEGSYCTFYLVNQSKIVVSKPLKEYEAILPKPLFIRTHKSYLVNIKSIYAFQYSTLKITMQSENIIPVSRRRKNDFISCIKDEKIKLRKKK